MIRTLAEVHADRVTVTVTLDTEMSGPLTIDRVQGAVTQREISELENELARRTRERDEREQARAALEKSMGEEVRKLRAQVAEYDRDRKTERDRADQATAQLGDLKDRNTELAAQLGIVRSRMTSEVNRANQSETNRKLEKDRNDRLQGRMTTAEARVDELTKELAQETERADQNKAWAERTETRLKEADTELERFRKHHVCTDACKPNEHVAFTGKTMLRELEELLHDERERADKAEADLAALKSETSRELHGPNGPHAALAEARRVVGKLATQIQAARELLTTDDIYQARRMDCSRTGTAMGYAIGAALRVLTAPPTPPGPPADETSQA